LVASLGTPYQIKTANTILFLEDLAAKPYQIDRMLMQLKLAGKFDAIRGIVFGEMIDCNEARSLDYTLPQVIMRIIGYLGVPIVFGMKSGHVSSRALTLPFGVKANIVANATGMAFSYEAAVQKSPAAIRG
jgi:muramoyltetrapeptide carboxypeptidase